MKKLFFTLFATILVSLPVQSSLITANNGEINCDGIICPANSVSCTVSKKTSDDLRTYKYIRTCFDAKGITTKKVVEEDLPNPDPETSIDTVSSFGGSSSVSVGTLSDEERQKLESIVKDQEKYWEQWTSNFNQNLQKTFENNFPPGFPFN